MSWEGQTEKWQSKELDSSYAQNQWWKWTELKKKKKTILELWKLKAYNNLTSIY